MHIVSARVNEGDAIADASSRSGSSVGSACIIIRNSSSRNSSRRMMSDCDFDYYYDCYFDYYY